MEQRCWNLHFFPLVSTTNFSAAAFFILASSTFFFSAASSEAASAAPFVNGRGRTEEGSSCNLR